MRGIFYIIALFSLLNGDELTEALAKNNNQNSWEHFDYKNTKEAPKIQEENVDFKSTFDSLLSKTLENNNGIDKTDGNLDFQNENAQVKNLSSLYEGENNSLLFQKELFVAQDNYNYSGGLINRYEKDDFLFGVNGFIDKQKEQKDTKSFGTEFGYSKFIKAYSNYYIPNEAYFFVMLILAYKNFHSFAFSCDFLFLKVPLISRLIIYNQNYYFFMVFSLLLKNGISISKAFDLAIIGLENKFLIFQYKKLFSFIDSGLELSQAFKKIDIFDSLVFSMLSVAMKSGRLEVLSEEIAKYYQQKSENLMDRFLIFLEPMMTLFVALLVLFLALGIFLPMWELSSGVNFN